MKKWFSIGIVILLVSTANLAAAAKNGHQGPAPNSGDGISDGSGFDTPNGSHTSGKSKNGVNPRGPAPNSGDGIPDGSGY